jgi:hypothetical protein
MRSGLISAVAISALLPRLAMAYLRKYAVQKGMSALPPKADMCGATRDVRLVPIADSRSSPILRGRYGLSAISPVADLAQGILCGPQQIGSRFAFRPRLCPP